MTENIDLKGTPCPLNYVKAKLALEKLGIGDTLTIELDPGEPVQNVPLSFREDGQEILDVQDLGTYAVVKVLKKKD